jgi:hypothetical protein
MSFPFSDLGPDLVLTFATPLPVWRLRRGATTLDGNGFVIKTAPMRTQITAVIYPATGKDVRVMPEGKRTEEIIKVISTSELRAELPGVYPSDQIEYQGKTFEVSAQADWSANANYYSVLCTRVNVPTAEG